MGQMLRRPAPPRRVRDNKLRWASETPPESFVEVPPETVRLEVPLGSNAAVAQLWTPSQRVAELPLD